ncbi:hypothetical protein [Hornefia butyriciproducens]|uniref:tetratricopeptide repeat protein n=1 Tax=Hornefia butyriciproducens TaxID=2652293 RepID=UPI003F894F12
MNKKEITLTTDQMQQIARFDLTFKDLIGDSDYDSAAFTCSDVYTYTVDDLYCALKNLKEADLTLKKFGEDWFYPITQLSEAFDLDRACGRTENTDGRALYPGLTITESEYFDMVWANLEFAWEDHDGEKRLSEVYNFDVYITELERYFGNRSKPVLEWDFSKEEKENYIRFFNDEWTVENAEEPELALARKFIEERIEKDSRVALYTKGYACYGGNRLYSCDWEASRDCLTRLFAIDDDPQFANTLGYIYYYGRCNGGAPEYEKAFSYFVFAAANGLYEGKYKLADMYCHGSAGIKSERAARHLYSEVYEDNLIYFNIGEQANFADAALRMGNVYAKGIGTEIDLTDAYYYYLQAYYAACLRAQDSNFFGDATVVINAQKALEDVEKELPEDYFEEYMEYITPDFFADLAAKNNYCILTRTRNKENQLALTAECNLTESVPDSCPIFLTIPQIKFCEQTTKVTLIPDRDAGIWFKNDEQQIRYNFCEWSNVEARYEFFCKGELVGWIRSDSYRFYGRTAEAPTGPEYRIASVRFGTSGRTYDYICDLDDVGLGDIVVVEGYDGETEVTVVQLITKHASELALPVERYKKIVRKA